MGAIRRMGGEAGGKAPDAAKFEVESEKKIEKDIAKESKKVDQSRAMFANAQSNLDKDRHLLQQSIANATEASETAHSTASTGEVEQASSALEKQMKYTKEADRLVKKVIDAKKKFAEATKKAVNAEHVL